MNQNAMTASYTSIILSLLALASALVYYILTHPQTVVINRSEPSGPQAPITTPKSQPKASAHA